MVVAWLGPWQFVILAAVIVFVFGTARFGRALRGLKAGSKELKRGYHQKDRQVQPPPPES